MEESLKVSIIIPVHNSEETLKYCIDSIISQSYKNIECILVENGSVDDSKKMCFLYAEQYENIIAVSTQNPGVSNARNIGLSLANGDIIGFCDADDFLEPDAIKVVIREFLNNSNVVAVFGGFFIGKIDDNKLTKDYLGLRNQQISTTKALQLTIINDLVMGSVWNKYYRADAVKEINFDLSLSFCEDMHFNARVLNAIQSRGNVMIVKNPLYCYMENAQSVTHNIDILFDDNGELKYITALKKIDNECNLDKETEELLKMKMAYFCIDSLKNMNLDKIKKQKLFQDLQKCYICLLKHITVNNWKWNLKRAFSGLKILITGIENI